MHAHQVGWSATPLLWVHTFMIVTLMLLVLYIAIYVYVARRDRGALWRRL